MKTKIFTIILFIFFTSAINTTGAQDSTINENFKFIAAQLNNLTRVAGYENIIHQGKIIFQPEIHSIVICNQANASIDFIDVDKKNINAEIKHVDISEYGNPEYIASGNGVFAIIVSSSEKKAALLCLAYDGSFLRLLPLSNKMDGIYYNAFSEQFYLYKYTENGYKIQIIEIYGGAAYLAKAEVKTYEFPSASNLLIKNCNASNEQLQVKILITLCIIMIIVICLCLTFCLLALVQYIKKSKSDFESDNTKTTIS